MLCLIKEDGVRMHLRYTPLDNLPLVNTFNITLSVLLMGREVKEWIQI
jgi:hypothetical protein